MKEKQKDRKNIFEDMVREHFRKGFGADAQVDIRDVRKNNGVMLRGLTVVLPHQRVMPTLYLEEYYQKYEKGVSAEGLLAGMEEVYRTFVQTDEMDLAYLDDYREVCPTLRLKMVNYEENEDYLRDIPHRRWLDLAVICQSRVRQEPQINAVITVNGRNASFWGVTQDQLICEALENSVQQDAESIVTMEELLEQLGGGAVCAGDEARQDMYVLSNESRMNGAAVLAYPGIFEKCAEKAGGDYFIIPSSIHEVLILVEEEERTKELLELVRTVNNEHVFEEERLSYHVYRHYVSKGIVRDMVTGETVTV